MRIRPFKAITTRVVDCWGNCFKSDFNFGNDPLYFKLYFENEFAWRAGFFSALSTTFQKTNNDLGHQLPAKVI